MRVTLRMPKAMVSVSTLASASGSLSPVPPIHCTWAWPRPWPTPIIGRLGSQTITRRSGPAMRAATSPVPPARSTMVWPARAAAIRTKRRFHRRWMPRLIRSFITS